MNLQVFPKALVFFIAFAFIIYGISPYANTWDFVKLLAVAFGLSLLSPFLYPHIRGIRKGDRVELVFEEEGPFRVFYGNRIGVALENGRVGGRIRVEFGDGREESGIVVAYAGVFATAKAKAIEKEIKVV